MIISFLLYTVYGGLDSKITILGLPQENSRVEIKNQTSLNLLQKNSGVEIKNHTSLDLPQESHGVEIKNHTSLGLFQKNSAWSRNQEPY